MGRHLIIDWQDDPETLLQQYRAENRPDVRPRLHALWLLNSGYALQDVCSILGVHYRTLQQWVAWYREGGIAAVRSHPKAGAGHAPRLSPAQEAELADLFFRGTFHNAREAIDWVSETFGVDYTQSGMYSLLVRIRRNPAAAEKTLSEARDLLKIWDRLDAPSELVSPT